MTVIHHLLSILLCIKDEKTHFLSLWCIEYHRKQMQKKKNDSEDLHNTRRCQSRGKETPKPAWGNQEDFTEVVMLELRS